MKKLMDKLNFVLGKTIVFIAALLMLIFYTPGLVIFFFGLLFGWIKEFVLMGIHEAEFSVEPFKLKMLQMRIQRQVKQREQSNSTEKDV